MGVFSDDLKSKKIDKKTLRRAWAFSAPYRPQLSVYIVAIIVVSIFGVAPPLVTRQIIDKAIPSNDRGSITSWVILLVAVAILASGLSALIRWLGAVIGEGVPRSRATGRPVLRGVPRSLAALFGVKIDWPDTGTSPWLEALDERERVADVR